MKPTKGARNIHGTQVQDKGRNPGGTPAPLRGEESGGAIGIVRRFLILAFLLGNHEFTRIRRRGGVSAERHTLMGC